MVGVELVSGAVWLVCGLAICYLGYLIAFRGRADLHANYDEDGDVDSAYVSRRAGGTALLMGVLVVGYAIREMVVGFSATALGGLIVVLLALSYLTRLFARGWGAG